MFSAGKFRALICICRNFYQAIIQLEKFVVQHPCCVYLNNTNHHIACKNCNHRHDQSVNLAA